MIGFLYGTAWKEDRTEALVAEALAQGFRGIDSANQRKHYREDATGRAVRKAISSGTLERSALFVQSKFTYLQFQYGAALLPYDPEAPIDEQVRRSFEGTLAHFGTEYLDSYLLHGPEGGDGLTPDDWTVWKTMEALFDEGRIRHLGVSNFSVGQIEALARGARVMPSFVQNRCYPAIGWDRSARDLCRRLGITYQAFNLVREPLLRSPALIDVARRSGATPAQVLYRWAQRSGMLPLTGTTNPVHMREALEAEKVELDAEALATVEGIRG